MPITDTVQLVNEATVALIDADVELRTLFNRTSALVVPWDSLALDGALPVIAYVPVAHVPLYENTNRLVMQFAAFGATPTEVNKAVKRLTQILTTTAYAARGVSVYRDPESPASRSWPGADSTPDDSVVARADVTLTFLIAD